MLTLSSAERSFSTCIVPPEVIAMAMVPPEEIAVDDLAGLEAESDTAPDA